MNIVCNDKTIALNEKANLYDLLEVTEYATQKGIAVAVNNCVIRKHDWESHQLQENDKVLIVSATKGG
jgi:sulfur carrier protein